MEAIDAQSNKWGVQLQIVDIYTLYLTPFIQFFLTVNNTTSLAIYQKP